VVVVDPKPLFEISPYLYMQFMEPLGTTDGSVEAAWDYEADDWREDLIDVVRDLGPGAIRFGGLFSRYYRWREGVGPVEKRPPMRNYVWGGVETNRVGTGEFVDFCRRVGAEPLCCVNFLSDGRRQYWKTPGGAVRTGDAAEAADWVSYCNDPDNRERRAIGETAPYNIKLWQLGNETFCGTRWTTNAVMIPVPRGRSYLMPVASVMRLFAQHNGRQGVAVSDCPSGLDIAASRTGNRFFLHAVNLNYSQPVQAAFSIIGMPVTQGRVLEIAPGNLREYVNQDRPDTFAPREKPITASNLPWRFSGGSVSVVELESSQGIG